jgi:hypothetical protein
MAVLAEDGYLERSGDWYNIPLSEDVLIRPDEQPITTNSASVLSKSLPLKIEPRPKKKNEVKSFPVFAFHFIKWSMFGVSMASMVLSTYYNTKEALEYFPWFLAVVSAVMTVLFLVSAFEAGIYVWTRESMKWRVKIPVLCVCVALWVAGVTLSMQSVMAQRYHAYITKQTEKAKEVSGFSSERYRFNDILIQKKEIETRIKKKQGDVDGLRTISSTVKSIDDRDKNYQSFADTHWRISVADKEVEGLYRMLSDLRGKEQALLDKYPELVSNNLTQAGVSSDYYAWVESATAISKDRMQFVMFLAPAFLYDWLSPITLAIALFLRKKD